MVVVGVEEHQVTGEVGVHELEGEGSRQGSKERAPHHFVREVVGDLQQTDSAHTVPLLPRQHCVGGPQPPCW